MWTPLDNRPAVVFVAGVLDASITDLRARVEAAAGLQPATGFAAAWTTNPVNLRYGPLLIVCGAKVQQWVCYVVRADVYAGITHPRYLLRQADQAARVVARLARLYTHYLHGE